MTIGIPYGEANDDGSITCPECGVRCYGFDEYQSTDEDAETKGAATAYALHYQRNHAQTGDHA